MTWFQRSHDSPSGKLKSDRLVVFDLETTGLNVRRDKPLAIGAVAIEHQSISFQDSFQARIREDRPSHPQALFAHRLTEHALENAQPPDNALTDFLHYVRGCPCLAYHCDLDDGILQRSLKQHKVQAKWPISIDVAQWMLWLHPELGPKPPTLDQALAFARIRRDSVRRHDACSDAWLTAQLALTLLHETLDRDVQDLATLRDKLKTNRKLLRLRAI